MKKIKLYFTALLVLLVLNGCTNNEYAFPFINIEEVAVACTFTGDVHLQTQTDVDNFILTEYCTVDGNLTIGDAVSQQSDIIDLSGLAPLHKVNGFLRIRRNWELTSLNGLENVFHVGGYLLVGSSAVENLNVFQDNPRLTSLANFNDLSIGQEIEGNGIGIRNNDALTNLNGFETISNFTGLVAVHDNDNLRDLCDLQSIFVNGTIGIVRIEDNFLNPIQTDIEIGTNSSI
jgi:hypothetical protein